MASLVKSALDNLVKNIGFVLIELVVVLAILSGLIGLAVINVGGSQQQAFVSEAMDILIVDLKSQQTRAMNNTLYGAVVPNGYGVRFESDRYILFAGLTYQLSDSTNSIVMLDEPLAFDAILLPNQSIVFASRSGEMVGYSPDLHSVTLKNTQVSEQKTLEVNRYGVIATID